MSYTERDEKQDEMFDNASQGSETGSDGSSRDKLPFAPADDDDSPLGSTDQHSDA